LRKVEQFEAVMRARTALDAVILAKVAVVLEIAIGDWRLALGGTGQEGTKQWKPGAQKNAPEGASE
jgi:tRNA C32,U32 (ribose-2'-O)-methylase TrmJ